MGRCHLNFIGVLLVLVQHAFAQSPAETPTLFPKDLVLDGEKYSCRVTQTVTWNHPSMGKNISIQSLCSSPFGNLAFYRQGSPVVVITHDQQLTVKYLEQNHLKGDYSEIASNMLSAYLPGTLGNNSKSLVVDKEAYRMAKDLASRQLASIRKQSLRDFALPNSILVAGVEATPVSCKRGRDRTPQSGEEWLSFGTRPCALYLCTAGKNVYLATYGKRSGGAWEGDSEFPVLSVESGHLGPTYKATQVFDEYGVSLAKPKFPGTAYTSENTTLVQNSIAGRYLRQFAFEACDDPNIDSFRNLFEIALKKKVDELSDMDLVEELKEAIGTLEKVLKPRDPCKIQRSAYRFDREPQIVVPTDRSAITEKEVNELFDSLKKREDISSSYLPTGCEARAHIIASDLDKKGYFAEKVFIQADLLMPEKNTDIQWSGHVATTVAVQKSDGTVERRVLDPSLFDKPVPIKTWLQYIKHPYQRTLLWSSYPPPTNFKDYQRTSVTIAPWTAYWPPEKPASTPEEKQRLLERALLTNKGDLSRTKKIEATYRDIPD